MNFWFDSIVAQEHYRDILREAENDRRIAQVLAHSQRQTLRQRVTKALFTRRPGRQSADEVTTTTI